MLCRTGAVCSMGASALGAAGTCGEVGGASALLLHFEGSLASLEHTDIFILLLLARPANQAQLAGLISQI